MKNLIYTVAASLSAASFVQADLLTGWTHEVVDPATYTSISATLEVDKYGKAHVGYVKRNNSGDPSGLYHGLKSNGSWVLTPIGDGSDQLSLALDSNQHYSISYHLFNKYVKWDGVSHSIEDVGASFPGFYSSKTLRVDGADVPHICSVGFGALLGSTPTVCYFTKNAGTWVKEVVANSDVELTYAGFDLDPNTDQAHFSYQASTSLDIMHVERTGVNTYASSIVESSGAGGDLGKESDLEVDQNGTPHILYTDDVNNRLRYSYRDSGGAWVNETVVSNTSNDYRGIDLEIDALGRIHVATVGDGSGVVYAMRDIDGTWSDCRVLSGMVMEVDLDLEVDACGNVFMAYSDDVFLGAGNIRYSANTTRDLEDADGDGIPSLVELLTGTDPGVANSCVVSLTPAPGGGSWQFAFPRFTGGVDNPDGSYTWGEFTYTIMMSTDLENWVASGTAATYASLPLNATHEQFVATFSPVSSKFFVRLAATRN